MRQQDGAGRIHFEKDYRGGLNVREISIIVAFLNVVMAVIVILFSVKLNWRNKADRPSIIGFSFMTILYAVSAILLFAIGRQLW